MHVSESDLRSLVGEKVAGSVVAAAQRRRTKRRLAYPGFTVQSMQQMGFLRWGSQLNACTEVVIPAKIITSTGTISIMNGVFQSLPAWHPEKLKELASKVRVLVLRFFPDGHPSNRLVMAHIYNLVKQAVPLESHCVSHLLQLVWETGAQDIMVSALYGFTQLSAKSNNNGKVALSIGKLADRCPIIAGFAPPPDHGYNACVLRHTVRRELHVNSFFTDVGAVRHDAVKRAQQVEDLDQLERSITSGLNAPWFLELVHYCWDVRLQTRCCESERVARSKLRGALEVTARYIMASLRTLAQNKWRSVMFTLSKIGLGILLHGVLKDGFANSLGSAAELRKALKAVHDSAQAAVAAAAHLLAGGDPADLQDIAEAHPADAYRVLRGKRTLGAHDFFSDQRTQFRILGMLIVSTPVDKLHHTFFEAESFAREKGGRAGGRERVGLLQSIVSRDGILLTVQQQLASGLLEPTSDYQHLTRIAHAKNLSPTFCSNEMRALQLRMSASFRGRFLNTFWNDPWTIFQFIDANAEQKLVLLTSIFSDGCPLCKGKFLVRLAERLQAPPLLSVAEQLAIVEEVLLSCAEDPLIISMYGVELLHAESRTIVQTSLTKRKQLPVTAYSSQHLSRMQALHKATVGKAFIEPESVKACLAKTPSLTGITHRRLTGHAMFCKQRNHERNSLPKPLRQEYSRHLQAVHEEWRVMPDDDKLEFEQRAEVAESVRPPTLDMPMSDPHATHDQSPCGIGSRTYPVSGPHLWSIINELLPHAKKFLRNAYDACRAADNDFSRLAGVVIPDKEFADVPALGRLRRANRPCFEKHPGICKTDELFNISHKLHRAMNSAMRGIGCDKQHNGNCLYLFTGFRRKRQAREVLSAMRESSTSRLVADHFIVAWLSDQMDVRAGIKTFTMCQFDLRDGAFCFGQDTQIRLVHLCGHVLDEQFGHGLARSMISLGARWWLVAQLSYNPVPDVLHTVEAVGLLGAQPCFHEAQLEVKPPKPPGDPIEEAYDMVHAPLSKPPEPPERHFSPDFVDNVDLGFSPASAASAASVSDGTFDGADTASSHSLGQIGPGPDTDADESDIGVDPHEQVQHDVTRASPLYARRGNKIMWDGVHIGSLTAWKNNISCRCRLAGHHQCKSPASTRWPSDTVLIDWLLLGVASGIDKEPFLCCACCFSCLPTLSFVFCWCFTTSAFDHRCRIA